MWEIEVTDQFREWYGMLDVEQRNAIEAAVNQLEAGGPALRRPFVGAIEGSRHANMKELRPLGGKLRVLFAFDPRRMAILLIGGDKTDRWREWYEEMIPIADSLYDEHLDTLKGEGLL